MNRKSIFILLTSFVLPTISSLGISYLGIEYLAFFQNSYFSIRVIITLILGLLMALALVPTTFAALFLGFCWGMNGLNWIVIAYTFASIIAYYLGKSILGVNEKTTIANSELGKKFQKIMVKEKSWVVFTGRISPIFPFAFMNVFFVLFEFKIKDILTWGTLGMLPRTILAVYVGSEAASISKNWNSIHLYDYKESFFLLILGIACIAFLSYRIKNQWNKIN